jgi:hypothetical protein
MALHQGGECFTKWTHTENGQVIVRRLHGIVLQTRDRGPETISGDKLPESIHTWTGHPYVGVSLSQVLRAGKGLSRVSKREKCQLPATATWWMPREVKRRLVALQQAIERSTRLDFVENGEPMHRQVRRIEVQTHGTLYSITGSRLPEYIGIHSGQGYKDRHTAQILLRSEPAPDDLSELPGWPKLTPAWPGLRDVVHIALGVVGFLISRFLLELIISVG